MSGLTKKLVLVTGASGFIGAQVVEHLLQSGYAVRGTCRSKKIDQLRKNCTHPDFEAVLIEDLVSSDFSSALQGVHAVIHVASPVLHDNNIIEGALDGTLNLLRQAHAAKVYKIVLMGSLASTATLIIDALVFYDTSRVITHNDWSTATKEEASQVGTPFVLYATSKALAERAAWDFANAHPEMDIITILPPGVYGPTAKPQVITGPNYDLSTNVYIYQLISGRDAGYPPMIPPQYVDVRDVAKACVLSLDTPIDLPKDKRRILVCGGAFGWKEAARHIGIARENLKFRLVKGGQAEATTVPSARLDTSLAKEVLGISAFISWEQMIEESIDNLLHLEQSWTN